jgi:hypothetical protein
LKWEEEQGKIANFHVICLYTRVRGKGGGGGKKNSRDQRKPFSLNLERMRDILLRLGYKCFMDFKIRIYIYIYIYIKSKKLKRNQI